MENVNNSFFDGYYKEIWKTVIPAELTPKETDFIIQYFNLQPGSKVLDLMCGYGRHAIALAKKGIDVTAVDNLAAYVDEVADVAKSENLSLRAVKADAARYEPGEPFDLVICMGNSLNFFPPADTLQILKTVAAHLKPGGHLLINTWSLTEIAIPGFKEKQSSTKNGFEFIAESQYLFHPTRIETDTTIISPDNNTETKKAIDYIFSVAEMERMLNDAGLSLKEIYSIPGRKKFSLGDPRAYIIAEKK